ncbi:MAG: acyltransferase [Bacteroidales bacterium]|nr:acyltransferase [Bacteroidales bacterium]
MLVSLHNYYLRFRRRFYIKLYNLKYKGKVILPNDMLIGAGFKIYSDNSLTKLTIGKGAYLRDYITFNLFESGKITLGQNVFMNSFCSFTSKYEILIGNNISIGEGVKIYDHNHNFTNCTLNINEQGYSGKPVMIGDNVWIGSNVTILQVLKLVRML